MKPAFSGARRYARALLDVARERADPAAVRRALDAAAAAVTEHAELHAVLTHPAVGAEKKRAVVAAVFGRGDALVLRLLEILVDGNRVALLPAIARAYAALWNAQRGVVAAEVVSAVALDTDQRAELGRAVSRATGREVELAATVDPGVLGGVLLRMEGRIFDGTVRGRLRALKEHLATGASGA